MSELLTTRQVQDILKIDRITIYRMLNDGRLNGFKVGNQWRFPDSEVERLLGWKADGDIPEVSGSVQEFPSTCIKEIQEIFAGIIGIGAISVTLRGDLLAKPAFSSSFCALIFASESGCVACQQSLCQTPEGAGSRSGFQVCHAGLTYQCSGIKTGEQQIAWLAAGQYYLEPPNPDTEKIRLDDLAKKHHIPVKKLKKAAAEIPVLDEIQREQVLKWTPRVAGIIQSILYERSDFIHRLRRIAALTSIEPTLSE